MKSKEEFNQYEFEQIELVQSSEQKSSSTGRVKYFFCISTVPKMEKFRYGNFPLRNHISAKNSRQNVSSCLDGNLPSSNLKF